MIRIGTRGSQLALAQTRSIAEFLTGAGTQALEARRLARHQNVARWRFRCDPISSSSPFAAMSTRGSGSSRARAGTV